MFYLTSAQEARKNTRISCKIVKNSKPDPRIRPGPYIFVVEVSGRAVEVQVRTKFQHVWAEISEKYADIFGSEIKYGGGALRIRRVLQIMSDAVARYERVEERLERLEESAKLKELREEMAKIRKDLAEMLDEESARVEGQKGEKR